MTLGKRLKNIREENGLTQEELAKKMDISQRTISSWECDRNIPDMNTYKRLCEIYDCTIAYLTGTKERELGDISLEDIMFKLPSLSKDDLLRIKEHIKMLINQRDDILRMEEERRKIEAEKAELEQKLAEYDRMIERLNVAGIRRNKNDI